MLGVVSMMVLEVVRLDMLGVGQGYSGGTKDYDNEGVVVVGKVVVVLWVVVVMVMAT